MLRDRPAIVATDDHDVYSNDLWGRGGQRMKGNRCTGGCSGHPDWVNMVETTQMGHLPKLGNHFDGLGNRMTIWAIAPPDSPSERTYRRPAGSILDTCNLAGSGFGILRFNKPKSMVIFESWPIYDAETPLKDQFQHPGWPRTIVIKKPDPAITVR